MSITSWGRRVLDHPYSAALAVSSGAGVALAWSLGSISTYQRVVFATWFHHHGLTTHAVVVNGLMTLFFAAVGLEMSREFRTPTHHPRAALPAVAGAVGGMVTTACLSLLAGTWWHSSALRRGWGVPMATDIAFTLGIVALAGPRVPTALRTFLLTLAIADDVLSVVVLAFTGVAHVRVEGLALIVLIAVAGALVARRGAPGPVGLVVLVALWLAFEWSGVEPALAGVLAGFIVPVTTPRARHLEERVTRWSVALALPLFALVACGVRWSTIHWSGGVGRIIIATVAIRLVGKALGISVGVLVAQGLGARRHPSLTPPVLLGASFLCAIGFTVPLLFAGALFGGTSVTYGAFTVGLLVASVLGAVSGVALLRWSTRRRPSGPTTAPLED